MIKAFAVLFLFVLVGCTLITDFDESSDSLYSIRDNLSSNVTVTLDSANRGVLDLIFVNKLPIAVTDDKFLDMLEDGTISVQVQNAEGVSLNLVANGGKWAKIPANAGEYYMELDAARKTLSIEFVNEVPSSGQALYVGGDYTAAISVNTNAYFMVEPNITCSVDVK